MLRIHYLIICLDSFNFQKVCLTLSPNLPSSNFDQLVHILALGYLIAGTDFSCFPEGRRLNVL